MGILVKFWLDIVWDMDLRNEPVVIQRTVAKTSGVRSADKTKTGVFVILCLLLPGSCCNAASVMVEVQGGVFPKRW